MLLTVLCWGFNFVALKLAYLEISAPAMALSRTLGMWAVLVLLCRLRGLPLTYPEGTRGQTLLQGFLAMGVYMVLFLEGMRTASPAEGAILLSAAPVFTALLSMAARHEPYSPGVIVGALIAMAGVALVVLGGGRAASGSWIGKGLLLASGLVWAMSVVVARPLVKGGDPFVTLTLAIPGALPVVLVYGWAATRTTPWLSLQPLTWAMIAYVIVAAGVIGFAGFYAGVRKLGGTATMLYQYFVPPSAAFFAYIVFGQIPRPLQALGLVIIFSGVAYSSRCRTLAQERFTPTSIS